MQSNMKTRITIIYMILLVALGLKAQDTTTVEGIYSNSTETLLNSDGKLSIGGYGEVHFNQPITKNQKELGTVDLHRMVMFLGYNFSKSTQFVSEIEFEYAKELWVEQAFLQQRINKFINFRAGLMLVPMGIVNEYHEPTTFNGVERPIIDNRIAPSTWREIGAGFAGTILPASIKYQVYVMNGLNGYDTKAVFTGATALREGRQKGSKAYVHSPSYTGKIEFYGVKNLNVGLSGYFGSSQSKLYSKLSDENTSLIAKADSSVIGISMLGFDARYQLSALELRGQAYYTSFSNTDQYNKFTATSGKNNDLGKSMVGYYVEAGYNVFKHCSRVSQQLIPFVRYEFYDTHNTVDELTVDNKAYENKVITTGLTLKLNKNAVIKTDLQFSKSAASTEYKKTINAGIGVMF